MQNRRKYPITFRQEEVGRVMECWRASTSCSLVGTGSVGKSNLIQHLMEPEVQAYYMQEVVQGRIFRSIVIDPNLLLPLSAKDAESENMRCWAGYELMMHRLFMAAYPFSDMSETDARLFYDTYQALQDGNNPLFSYIGLRYLELGLDILVRRGYQIVFMFDEFEELIKQLPVKFFLTLRGLRDRYKSHICFMTFSRRPLLDIALAIGIDPLEIEPFTELFSDNVIFVGPYNDADARDMLSLLMNRNQRQYPEEVMQFLMWATGSHAGLLRASFSSLELLGPIDRPTIMENGANILQALAGKSKVQAECAAIWGSLSEIERKLLHELVTPNEKIDVGNPQTQQAFSLLARKKLARIQGNNVLVEPPIFRYYVENVAE